MQQSLRIVTWLALVLCLFGFVGCGPIADRSMGLLYPSETPPPAEPEIAPTSELPSMTRTSEGGPVATLTWPVPEPSGTPTVAPPPTSAPEPTKEIAQQPPVDVSTPSADSATPLPAPATESASPTRTPESTAAPAVTPRQENSEGLVFLDGETVYRGAYLGENPESVAVAPDFERQAFRRGILAVAQGDTVELLDLASDTLVGTKLEVSADVEYVELMWGAQGRSLVYSALVAEGKDKSDKRRVELHILDVSGAQSKGELATVGQVTLDDVESVSLLRYDEERKRLLLVPRSEQPVFRELRFYDTTSGQLVDTYPAEGQGDVLVSPDGRYVLTEQFTDSGAQFALYDLQAQGEARPKIWPHEKGAYSMFPLWSPDGRQVAYLLRRDQEGESDPIEALGLWVLDIATGQAHRILEEDTPFSSLGSWTPEGDYIVGYHEADQGSHYYAVHPDGRDRRTLSLPTQTQILGWMPPIGGSVATRSSDGIGKPSEGASSWDSRLAATLDDPQAMAQVVAELVQGQSGAEEGSLASQIEEHLQQAGWPMDSMIPRLVRLADGIWAAQLPPAGVYVLQEGRAHRVGNGQVLLEARLQEGAIGLISAAGEAGNLQPTFDLLRQQDDGEWATVWSPEGQRFWVATDGVIRFAGQGLESLQVVGTSFGLDDETQTWDECRACAHRRITGTWVRQDDSYQLKTGFAADASPDTILWAMTARTPYALLHECIDRLSKGLAVDELVTDQGVVDQIRALGLLEEGRRLIPLEESASTIRFEDVPSQAQYLASIEGERITRVEQEP